MRMFTLALALAAAGPPALAREAVPPEKLTAEALRVHVKAFLDDPKRADGLKRFAVKVDLAAGELTYVKKVERYEIVWSLAPREGVTLTAADERLLRLGLEDTLQKAVRQGGLLTDDAGVEYAVRIITPLPPPEAEVETPPQPEARPVVVPAVPRMSSEYVWRVVPRPCGSCIPADFVFDEVPVPVLPPAVWHGEWPAEGLTVETPPRMEPTDRPAASGRLERMSVVGLTAADGVRLHFLGRALFFRGDYDAAARNLRAAATLAPDDARAWYFLALAEWSRGDLTAARAAAAEGVRLQRRGPLRPDEVVRTLEASRFGLPKDDEIGRALERVQGPARSWLRDALDRGDAAPDGR